MKGFTLNNGLQIQTDMTDSSFPFPCTCSCSTFLILTDLKIGVMNLIHLATQTLGQPQMLSLSSDKGM